MKDIIDIIIPVFNEEENLPSFYKKLESLAIPFRPIFIDNASTDDSLLYLQSIPDAIIISHDTNLGYGASLRAGIERAEHDKLIIIDADCEYDPGAIPDIVEALNKYDVVHTSRFLGQTNRDMHPAKSIGNRLITRIFNTLFQEDLTDLYTGCKGYRRNAVSTIPLRQNGFAHVLEITAHLVRRRISIHEVEVRYQARSRGKSKMNHILETAKYLLLVFYYAMIVRDNRR